MRAGPGRQWALFRWALLTHGGGGTKSSCHCCLDVGGGVTEREGGQGSRALGVTGGRGRGPGVQTHSCRGLHIRQAEPRLRSQNIRFWVCPQDPCQLPALCPLHEGPACIQAPLHTPARCPSLPRACPHPTCPSATGGQLVRGQAPRPGTPAGPGPGYSSWELQPRGALGGGLGLALAQSQGASPAREEGKHPFVCSLSFCLRVSGDKSQVGQGACRLSRRPHRRGRTGTHRCGGWEPAEGLEPGHGARPWSRPAALLLPLLGPPRGHLLQEAGRMWLPSCLPHWPQSPSSRPVMGELPVRLDLRGRPGSDVLLWSSVARPLPPAIETPCPGNRWASCLFPTIAPHRPPLPLCIPAPGSPSPASILSTRCPPGPVQAFLTQVCALLETPCGLRAGPLLGALLPWPPVRHLQTCQRPGHHHPILTPSALPGFNSSRPFSPGTQPSHVLTALCLFRITLLPWAIKMQK